jgi:hypothetical protein
VDPVSLIAATTAAFNGVKQAVAIGQEIEQVFVQLSAWARLAGELNDAISDTVEERVRVPSIWEKIAYPKSETAEAFDIYIARRRLIEHEKAIKHMFLYGELQELGMDGYNELLDIRRQIHEQRYEQRIKQRAARIEYIENIKLACILAASAVALGLAIVAVVLLWPK